MSVKTKFSLRGLRPGQIVDAAAMEVNARAKIVKLVLPATLVTATSHNLGALGIKGRVIGAFASNRTVGTYTAATIKIRNATQGVDLTNTLDPATIATGGANAPLTQTAAMQAISNAATDQLVLVTAGTFTTQPVELQITLVIDPDDAASPINQ
jgi:hypothetical protein